MELPTNYVHRKVSESQKKLQDLLLLNVILRRFNLVSKMYRSTNKITNNLVCMWYAIITDEFTNGMDADIFFVWCTISICKSNVIILPIE